MDAAAGKHPSRRRWGTVAWWVLVATLAAATFLAYLRPDLVVDLGNRIWLCW